LVEELEAGIRAAAGFETEPVNLDA
jgi:hypothetical protein